MWYRIDLRWKKQWMRRIVKIQTNKRKKERNEKWTKERETWATYKCKLKKVWNAKQTYNHMN